MSTIRLGGMTVGYADTGTGEPLVLVHGHPFDRSMWRPQATALAERGWRVITPDLRGYGESTLPSPAPRRTTLTEFARDITALLDHLGVSRFVLGGLSMGGQIVMECHRLFPGRIRALVLADTFAEAETPDGKIARNRQADRLLDEGMAGYAAEVLPKMVAPATIDAQPDVAGHVLTMMRSAPPDGAAAALRGRAERPDYLASLGEVAVPALVIAGSDDEFTPVSDAETIRDRVDGARLRVIDGTAHLPNLERPAKFNDELLEFLSRLPDSVHKGS